MWDGGQSLVEERTADRASDVSNSGLIGNIHGLMLDEPLAVRTQSQGMSSVFLNGAAGDLSLGNNTTEIDWPASTQAQTYFAASPDAVTSTNPKLWMGTFVASGQGTTGMLYRRNRYFDPKSGQFTQADPIGIAGGMNVFGFAEGDPVNFSDPFGLQCPAKTDPFICIGHLLRPVKGPLEVGGTLAIAPLAGGMGMAGERLAVLGLVGRGAASGPTSIALASGGRAAAKLAEEGIYEFTATSGRTYVGQSGNISRRITQHVRSGKLAAEEAGNVRRTEVLGGKTAREIAEQHRINELGGIQNLENKVNPIGPSRQHLIKQ
jgi:RHS repeat-associated protein